MGQLNYPNILTYADKQNDDISIFPKEFFGIIHTKKDKICRIQSHYFSLQRRERYV